ncbi:MAG: DUF3575 domain-containing protein [Tannerellaceae bacterium]|jgi:hypothetical protein|nr:DUF3575 domain-containing protein [Tannerellaceae bacterium]
MNGKNLNKVMTTSVPVNKMSKRWLIITLVIAFFLSESYMFAQQASVKSNMLHDVTTTMNIGLEVGLSSRWTLDLPVSYNPWDFSDNRKLKLWLIQPEVRYWMCEKFSGHFFGLHAHVGGYNVGAIKWLGMEEYRYQGTLYGAGFSYGYQWVLNPHWSIEATLGFGYAYLSSDKYQCERCASKIGDVTKNYFGPTRAGVSLIYMVK